MARCIEYNKLRFQLGFHLNLQGPVKAGSWGGHGGRAKLPICIHPDDRQSPHVHVNFSCRSSLSAAAANISSPVCDFVWCPYRVLMSSRLLIQQHQDWIVSLRLVRKFSGSWTFGNGTTTKDHALWPVGSTDMTYIYTSIYRFSGPGSDL